MRLIPANNKAFSLIELLIVIMIIGIGLIAVTPWLVRQGENSNRQVEFFNKILMKYASAAKDEAKPICIVGFLGSSHLLLPDGKRVSIPDGVTVSTAWVDEKEQSGLEYHIYIYPEQICDYFVLMLSNGQTLASTPLLLKTSLIKHHYESLQ